MGDTFVKHSVSAAQAHTLIAAAERKALELGLPSCIAVVDESGLLKGYSRMDGAGILGIQLCQDKAFTAAGLGMGSHDWYEFIQKYPGLAAGAAINIERNVIFGGGLPITRDGRVIGGIGVVGGTPDQDIEIAQAALQALG
jgi:uncharacterized protein GlcG (DUF336 family)